MNHCGALNEVKQTKTQNIFEQDLKYMLELSQDNNKEFLEVFEEFTKNRIFQELLTQDVKNVVDALRNALNSFLINNGYIRPQNFKLGLTEDDIFKINLFLMQDNQPIPQFKNRFYSVIYKYILENLDVEMVNFSLDKMPYVEEYLNGWLSYHVNKEHTKTDITFKKSQDVLKTLTVSELIKMINDGQFVKYSCDGFQDNNIIYLLSELCYLNSFNYDFKTFDELINYIIGFCQLNLNNKVFKNHNGEHSLITFAEFGNIEPKPNKRYVKMLKYLEHSTKSEDFDILNKKYTKLTTDSRGKYLETHINKEQYEDLFKTLNDMFQEYKKEDNKDKKEDKAFEIYDLFVSSQVLTRSTSLCGLILLKILLKKQFRVKPNEQPDWACVLNCDIEFIKSLFDFVECDETKKIKPLTLRDVLSIVNTYISMTKSLF